MEFSGRTMKAGSGSVPAADVGREPVVTSDLVLRHLPEVGRMSSPLPGTSPWIAATDRDPDSGLGSQGTDEQDERTRPGPTRTARRPTGRATGRQPRQQRPLSARRS